MDKRSDTLPAPGDIPMITEPAVVMIDGKPCPLMTYNFITQQEEQSKQVVLPEVSYTKEEMDKFLQLTNEASAMKRIVSNSFYKKFINFVIGSPS